MHNKTAYLKLFWVSSYLVVGSCLIIASDQALKYKIRRFGGFYICNSGISFDLPFFPILFWLTFAVFLLFIAFQLKYILNKGLLSVLSSLSLILMSGGVISNIIDRISQGCVVDFISIGLGFFPLFNLADVAIFLGGCCLIASLFSKKTPSGV